MSKRLHGVGRRGLKLSEEIQFLLDLRTNLVTLATEDDLARAAIEELPAERLFQPAHLQTDSCLRERRLVGGCRERARPCDDSKRLEHSNSRHALFKKKLSMGKKV
jgi:hypothetical protein